MSVPEAGTVGRRNAWHFFHVLCATTKESTGQPFHCQGERDRHREGEGREITVVFSPKVHSTHFPLGQEGRIEGLSKNTFGPGPGAHGWVLNFRKCPLTPRHTT